MPDGFSFRLIATDGAARAGEITTSHGVVRTPAFMPVGTQGAIKGVHHDDVRAAGADIMLANTYHLLLRPSAERALFGSVQGGDHEGLREASMRRLVELDFHGYAIGGLAVGESEEVMLRMVAATAPALPAERPRYLMGVGTPSDILKAIARGIDMFDCVLPTRNGRHGLAFTRFGPINIKNAHHAEDARPLDAESRCSAAREFSRAYLHHLFKAGETLGGTLLSIVNLYYYQDLMAGAREAIARGGFADYIAEVQEQWTAKRDLPPPP